MGMTAICLRIYDLCVYNLGCRCLNVVYLADLRHLVICLELFCYALLLGHLLYQPGKAARESARKTGRPWTALSLLNTGGFESCVFPEPSKTGVFASSARYFYFTLPDFLNVRLLLRFSLIFCLHLFCQCKLAQREGFEF